MSETTPPPAYLQFDPETRRLRLDPREKRFFQNPYETYRWLQGQGGAFFWEFSGDDANGTLAKAVGNGLQ